MRNAHRFEKYILNQMLTIVLLAAILFAGYIWYTGKTIAEVIGEIEELVKPIEVLE